MSKRKTPYLRLANRSRRLFSKYGKRAGGKYLLNKYAYASLMGIGAGKLQPISNDKQIHKYTLTIRNPINVSAGTAGSTIVALSYAFNFPTYGRVATGYGQYPQFVADYGSLFSLYDEYRVTGIRVTVLPNATQTQTTTALAETMDDPLLCYTYKDDDDGALPATENAVLNKQCMPRSMAIAKPIVRTYLNPDRKHWINTSLVGTNPTDALVAQNLLPQNAFKSVKQLFVLYRDTTNAQHYGRILVNWMVQFRGLKDA